MNRKFLGKSGVKDTLRKDRDGLNQRGTETWEQSPLWTHSIGNSGTNHEKRKGQKGEVNVRFFCPHEGTTNRNE